MRRIHTSSLDHYQQKFLENNRPAGLSIYIPGHTGLLGTLTLTQTTVSANAAGGVELTGTRPRVHGHGLADDEAIADELADGLAGVGVGDLVHLIRVEPNLALAAAHHGGGQALLGAEVDPVEHSGQLVYGKCGHPHHPATIPSSCLFSFFLAVLPS